MIIELGFPPPELEPNARPNRYAKARAAKLYRWSCNVLCRKETQGQPMKPGASVSVTFRVRNKRRDLDNLVASFKPGQDGLVDAGLVPDDNAASWAPEWRVEYVGKGERQGVIVEIA